MSEALHPSAISVAKEAKLKAEQENRRSLEIRAAFYEKLATLDAGSIAVTVSVGIAMLGKADSRYGSVHSHLSWLLWIAAFLWISLICSISHNSNFVKIGRLEAEQSKAFSHYLDLLCGQESSLTEIAQVMDKHLADTMQQRIHDAAMNAHHTEQSVYRAVFLGKIAVAAFLIAYTLVVVAVVHLWWITR